MLKEEGLHLAVAQSLGNHFNQILKEILLLTKLFSKYLRILKSTEIFMIFKICYLHVGFDKHN